MQRIGWRLVAFAGESLVLATDGAAALEQTWMCLGDSNEGMRAR